MKNNKDFGWTPLLWLIYLVFLFIQPAYSHFSLRAWVLLTLVTVCFLAIYFSFYFSPRVWRGRLFVPVVVMQILGFGYMPFNTGATTFLVYASALAPFALSRNAAVATVGCSALGMSAEAFWLHWPWVYWIPAAFMCFAVGLGNIYFAERRRVYRQLEMAHEEVERLAKLAERERIARDLHDVLGHTLTVIVLKAELAQKLLRSDRHAAEAEMREVERTARKTLEEVRHALRGYRAQGINAEIAHARRTLEDAGIVVECHTDDLRPAPMIDSALSLALREGVTNVVRHSGAGRCSLRLFKAQGMYVLSLRDDGTATAIREGMGLEGMRQRVETLGGTVNVTVDSGVRLDVMVPDRSAASESVEAGENVVLR